MKTWTGLPDIESPSHCDGGERVRKHIEDNLREALGVKMGEVKGGIERGKDVVIEEGAIINVKSGFIGDRSIIRSGARIEGNHVELGTESYLDHGAWIGGGSCWDPCAELKAGCWLHMGWNSQVNIARGVYIGDEVGLGIETKIFTHGVYLPVDRGFPAQWGSVYIGSRVWLPHAWVNPNVMIGDDIVVAAGSIVTRSLEDPGLYMGRPAKIRNHLYPPRTYALSSINVILEDEKLKEIVNKYRVRDVNLDIEGTIFNLYLRTITGPVTEETERVKNQLRRNGIRFKFYAKEGEYVPWD